jgi:hypothetical protein
MGFLKKFSLRKRIYLLLSLILCLLLGGIGIFLLTKPQETGAAWWDETWTYRKEIQINNGNSTDLEDFQVSFVIDTATLITAGKMQSNCSDIRVTDWSGNLLPHWVEENNPGCNNASTRVWVKVPNVYKGTNATTIFVYYGNAGASSVENGNLVFEFFDGFDEYSEWVGDTGNFSLNTDGTRDVLGVSGGLAPGEIFKQADLPSEYILEVAIKDADASANAPHPGFIFASNGTTSDYYGIYLRSSSNQIVETHDGTFGSFTSSQTMDNAWHVCKAVVNTGVLESLYFDNVQQTNFDNWTITNSTSHVGLWSHSSGVAYYDSFLARKYSPVELTTSTSSTEEVSPAPIAYWKFDEGTGTTIYDSSGQGNNAATGSGVTWASEQNCVDGPCTQFDGVTSLINAGDPPLLNLTEELTVSMWVYNQRDTGKHTFLVRKAAGGGGYGIYQNPSESLAFFVYFPTGSPAYQFCYTTNYTFPQNEWTHITGTFKQDDSLKIYINGVENMSCATQTSGPIGLSGNSLVLGVQGWWASDNAYFKGMMDEVKIYPYARTADQIKTDYITGSSATGSKVVMGSKTETSTTTPLSGKLLAHYRFDEGSGNTTYDTVNSQTGSVNGATWKAEGKYGKALDFAKNNESLMLDYMTWKDGQTGAVGSFGLNGTASENYRVVDTDPWGRKSVVWEARPDDVSGADGGWAHSLSTIDNTKTYRFSVWVNRKVTGNGSFYLGTNGYGSVAGVYYRSDGTTNTTNPYFWTGTPSQDTWTLVVGHVWPAGSGAGSNHPDSGRYTVADGYIGPISRDYIWRDETTSGRQRSYLYYSTNTDTRQQWIYPRVDIVDGTEPSIEELLNGYGAYGDDVFTEVAGTKESFSLWYDKDADGDWEHLVKSGSNYYVDGVLGTPAEFPLYNSANEVYVGRTSYSDYVTGIIDDVKIYNTTLTAEEVLLDYNQGRTTTLSQSPPSSGNVWGGSSASEYCVPGDTSTCRPPIAEWRFDENQGTTAKDISGNGYNTSLQGGVTWAKGKVGSALGLDGLDGYAEATKSISLARNSFSVSIWFKTTSAGDEKIFSPGFSYHPLQIYNGTLRICVNSCTAGTTSINDGKWHHAIVVGDGTSIRAYLDGNLTPEITQTAATGNMTGIPRIGSVGADDGTTSPQFFFEGDVDNLKVYDYARTPAQIAWDHNRGEPIGHWRLDECQGAIANDVSGNGNYGEITIGETGDQTSVGTCTSGSSTDAWYNGRTGKLNSSLNLDGVDDYVYMRNLPPYLLSLGNTNDLTIGAWINPQPLATTRYIVAQYYQYTIRLGSTNLLSAQLRLASGVYEYPSTSTVIPNNEWSHVLMTFKDGVVKFYVNGELVTTSSTSEESLYVYTGERRATIGAYHNRTSGFFLGQIDDARIYNYALTEKQIQLLYNDNAAVRF